MKKTKIICALPKFSYGEKSRDYSTEYQSFYPEIKKKFSSSLFFNTVNKNFTIEDMNKKFIDICLNYKPNYIFMSLSNYEIYIETLIFIKQNLNTILLNWCSDDSWRFEEHSKLYGKYFDYSITTDRKAHAKYKLNKLNSILANWGCPNQWLIKPKKSKTCKYEISFIGSSYMGRDRIINKLKKEGYKVNCYGYGWKNKPVKSSRFSKILNDSKISLNFARSRKNVMQTKARIFEITGCGSLCLTENSPDTNKFFKNNKELIIFKNYNDLTAKLSFILKNNSKRDEIAYQGFKKCKNNYLYSKIINQIFKKINKKKINIKENIIEYNYLKSIFYLFFLGLKILSLFFSKIINYKKSEKIFRRISFELELRIRPELIYSKKGWTSKLYGIL